MAFILFSSLSWADSNLIENFALHHCAAGQCLSAHGEKASISLSGRMLSASHVTMEIENNGNHKTVMCADFHADLVSVSFFCEGTNVSYSVNEQMLVRAF